MLPTAREKRRSIASEERYAASRGRCEGSERGRMRHLSSNIVLCKVRLVGTWIKRGEVVDGWSTCVEVV